MFRSKIILFGIVMLPVLLSACSSGAPEEISAETAAPIFQKGGCVACHVIPGVPGAVGTIGPDLSRMGEVAADQIQMPEYTGTAKTPADFIRESVVNPEAFISPECPSGPCKREIDAP